MSICYIRSFPFQFLLIASIFSYQRVTLENYPLPLRYELIAWFTMVGPLAVVPCAAFCTLYETWKKHMVRIILILVSKSVLLSFFTKHLLINIDGMITIVVSFRMDTQIILSLKCSRYIFFFFFFQPLLSVFDCSQWRHKNVNEGDKLGPKHIDDENNDYWVCFVFILIFPLNSVN